MSEGVVQLGALCASPPTSPTRCWAAGPEGYPSGVVREYYAFVAASLDKIPVVLDDHRALELPASGLPGYWQALLDRSRLDSPVIRTELFQNGRVVDHRTLDYRSPVFGVGSLSYSRAVNGDRRHLARALARGARRRDAHARAAAVVPRRPTARSPAAPGRPPD